MGIASGAAVGVMAGSLAGPIGAAFGGAVGAVMGALTGMEFPAETLPPEVSISAEESHWRTTYQAEPFYELGTSYEDYAPAYRLGFDQHLSHYRDGYQAAEPKLERLWNSVRGMSRLRWRTAREAVKAGWQFAATLQADQTHGVLKEQPI